MSLCIELNETLSILDVAILIAKIQHFQTHPSEIRQEDRYLKEIPFEEISDEARAFILDRFERLTIDTPIFKPLTDRFFTLYEGHPDHQANYEEAMATLHGALRENQFTYFAVLNPSLETTAFIVHADLM